ncbi:MAG: hypothetical protein ACREOO_12600 [bacterium]
MEKIFNFLLALPWRRIAVFLHFLYKQRRWALISSVLLLLIAFTFTLSYWRRANQYNNLINKTLQADLESTPQRFKGLEAFILSNLEPSLDENLKNSRFSRNFIQKCKMLKREIERFQPIQVKHPQLRVAPGKNEGKILTDGSEPGFLFVPVHALRTTLGTDPLDLPDKATQDSLISRAIENDQQLWLEVAFAQHLAEVLQGFTGIQIVGGKSSDPGAGVLEVFPIQVVFLTKNGLAHIFSRIHYNPSGYYGSQLAATTFLPSQSSFWPAFEQHKFGGAAELVPDEKQALGDYFHISRAHLDPSGHGIVLTLTRGLLLPNTLQVVLNFDLRFVNSKSVYPALEELIDKFGGVRIEVDCTIHNFVNISCQRANPANRAVSEMKGDLLETCWAWLMSGSREETEQELIENMESLIQSKVNENNRSEVCGNIQILNLHHTDPERGGILQASVPTGELSYDDNTHTMSFLLFSIDLTAYRKRTSYLAFGAAFAFTAMILILASSWWWASRDTFKHQQEFEMMRTILSKLPDLPWARLDLQHRICDFNEPFCKKLEYPFDDDTREKIIGVKFWRLCVGKDDADNYKRAQEARKKTGKFTHCVLNMRKYGKGFVKVKVISLEIPSAKNKPSSEIFCILVPFDFDTRSIRKTQA